MSELSSQVSGSNKKRYLIVTIIAVAALFVGSVAAYYFYFSSRALPGVQIAGLSVTGKTGEQIDELLKQKTSEALLTVDVSGKTETASLEDLGYSIDIPTTAAKAIGANRSIGGLLAFFSTVNVEPEVVVQESVTQTYLETLLSENENQAANASVQLNSTKDGFDANPAVEGKSVDSEQISDAATKMARTLTPEKVTAELVDVTPSITTEEATAVADAANNLVALEVKVSDGIETYTASSSDKAGWIVVASDNDAISEPKFDVEKAKKWVTDLAKSTNEDPEPGVRNVNSRGDVVSVAQDAQSGWKVTNADAIAEQLAASLNKGDGFIGDFDYDKVESDKWEEQIIADGAENLAYQAAPNEKWIDIDLSTYTVSAYEGATIVRGPISMVPGAPQTPTVTGTYKVYLKYETQTMRGENVDGSKYETPDVPWVTYFTGSYALHGAYWRSSFGYGGEAGSHGCVNMPVEEAKWFYDWSEYGTTVVSHY